DLKTDWAAASRHIALAGWVDATNSENLLSGKHLEPENSLHRRHQPSSCARKSGKTAHSVGPIDHGANSSSPTPLISLFVFLPLATARISSNICRPTTSTGVPSRMTPALMSMSSSM